MKGGVLRRLSGPVDRYGIAPDRTVLLDTSQNPTGPQGAGVPRVNLWQCLCLRWNRLSEAACSKCGTSRQ